MSYEIPSVDKEDHSITETRGIVLDTVTEIQDKIPKGKGKIPRDKVPHAEIEREFNRISIMLEHDRLTNPINKAGGTSKSAADVDEVMPLIERLHKMQQV